MWQSIDLSPGVWRKSSYSNTNGGSCVEVTDAVPGVVPVRDSKDVARGALVFPAAAWSTFVAGLKTEAMPGA